MLLLCQILVHSASNHTVCAHLIQYTKKLITCFIRFFCKLIQIHFHIIFDIILIHQLQRGIRGQYNSNCTRQTSEYHQQKNDFP